MRTSSFFAKKPSGLMRAKIGQVLNEFRDGVHRSIFTGKGIEFKRLRPYNPLVDRPTAIDDMASHRLSEEPEFEPYSRVRYAPKRISALVLLDTSEAMLAPAVKEEQAALLFWFFALSAFKFYDRFRVIAYAHRPLQDSDWLSGEDELADFFMRYHNLTKPPQRLLSFASVFSYLLHLELHDTVIFVISDFACAWNQEQVFLRGLGLRERNIKLVFCAIDEWEEFTPLPYAITMRDPRTGHRREYCREELRELKSKALAHLAAIEESLRPLGALFIRIPILADPLSIVRRALRRLEFK